MMADYCIQVDQHETHESPLLIPPQNQTQQQQQQQEQQKSEPQPTSQLDGDDLDQTLKNLETFLTFLGFNQSSLLSFVLSWVVFIILGVLLPVIILELSQCSNCEDYQIKDFELYIVASQACLAAASLICLSSNLRKYGMRRFLFVDQYRGHLLHFTQLYIQQIKNSLRLLVLWSLPCFILKVVREFIRTLYVHESWWLSIAVILVLILSWTYVSTITLSASILFHIICNLQIIHFDDYAKLLERDSDVLVFIEEHIRLRYHLSKISHRFRIFLLLQFCIVTASQSMTLFQTTGYGGVITVINGGDFAVSSLVQVVGIIICLQAATKISHRAQGIVSIVSRWHALATCSFANASPLRVSNGSGNLEAVIQLHSLRRDYSESDLESMDYIAMPTNTQYKSSYHKRQAFVTYLQNNLGGITIFGWIVDRGLITTIFFIELTLITFVLGKTVV